MKKPKLQTVVYEYYDFYDFFAFLKLRFGRYIDTLQNEYEDIQGGDDYCCYGFDDDYFKSQDPLHEQISEYILQEFGSDPITLGRL